MELNDKIVIYQTSDGQVQLDVYLENETVWLNANQMAMLFGLYQPSKVDTEKFFS